MREKLLAYARLLRLSNGPTAVADVWMGYAVIAGELSACGTLALATFASLCLYHGGMALNDAVDAEQDAIEKRARPIGQGRLSRRSAYGASFGLLFLGMLLGAAAALLVGNPAVLAAALILVALIAAYNSELKRSEIGPILMGSCRGLNVCLGACAAPELFLSRDIGPGASAAFTVGLYVTGVTVFARDEATSVERQGLTVGLICCMFGFAFQALALADGPMMSVDRPVGVAMWLAAAAIATRGMVAARFDPTPSKIGRGVGIAIQGLVVIDATLAVLYAGPMAGLAILALLPVTMILARWIPQT